MVARLEGLRLSIHKGAHPRPVREGIPFLGFVVYPDRRLLKRRKGVQFRRRLRTLLVEEPLEAAAASLTSWLNHVRYGNTVGLRKAILSAVLDTPRGCRGARRSVSRDPSAPSREKIDHRPCGDAAGRLK